jgi:biopolymer transport protein ExbB
MTPTVPDAETVVATGPLSQVMGLLDMGGLAMYAIGTLSVLTVALILWKLWALIRLGAFSGGKVTRRAVALWEAGDRTAAMALLSGRRSARARTVFAAMEAATDPRLDRDAAEAATEQVARAALNEAGQGLRFLELAASIGPLLGLLGTVTGMIAAFQGLQAAGVRADTATLAGGIWEALLTTAAGMAVAIPAMIAQNWFEGLIDGLRHDMEDGATRIFLAQDRARGRPVLVQDGTSGDVVNWAQAAARAVAQARRDV